MAYHQESSFCALLGLQFFGHTKTNDILAKFNDSVSTDPKK